MASRCLSLDAQKAVLRSLATQVIEIRELNDDPERLAGSPHELYQEVLKVPIDWQRIAAELGEDRNRIYHWYRETHSRNILNVKMTEQDRHAIRTIVIQGIRDRSILVPDFYRRIYECFGRKYPRQELRMTYNNMLRSRAVRAVLDECNFSLPPKRPHFIEECRRAKEVVRLVKPNRSSPQPTAQPLPLPAFNPQQPVLFSQGALPPPTQLGIPGCMLVPQSGIAMASGVSQLPPGMIFSLPQLQPAVAPPAYLPVFVPNADPDPEPDNKVSENK